VHGSLFALGGRGLDPALCAAMGLPRRPERDQPPL